MRDNRFVLDNNIWVSYFITNRQQTLIDIITKTKIDVFVCDELLQEFETVLYYPHIQKFKVNIRNAVFIMKDISLHFNLNKPIKKYIPGDVDDNYILALALQTNSGYVTSGDKHILSQKEILEKKYTKLKIITKAQFEKRFSI